jgi:hypothetical protein
MKLTKEQTEGLIRHTLTTIGGAVVMLGLVEEGLVIEIVGGIITAVGFVWSIVEKVKRG